MRSCCWSSRGGSEAAGAAGRRCDRRPTCFLRAVRRAIASSTVSSSRSPRAAVLELQDALGGAAARDQDLRYADQLGVGELHARGDAGAVVDQDAEARPRASFSETSRASSVWRALPAATTWTSAGATSAGQHRPLSSARLLGEGGDRAGDADAVGAHGHADRLAVLAEDVELEGVGVLAAQLEDVADLDGAVQLEAGAALRAGVALLDDDDVDVLVDLEVTARDDVLRVRVRPCWRR